MLKIILKKYYFNIFLNKKYFKKYSKSSLIPFIFDLNKTGKIL
jgi:hypothetical protein